MSAFRFLGWMFLLIAASACEKRLKNPELVDPIFNSLSSEQKQIADLIAKEEKNIETLASDYEKASPMSRERAIAKRDMEKTKEKLLALRQKAKYLEIRLKRRQVVARTDYSKALDNKEEWPKQAEMEAYLAEKRLRQANLSWDSRVPKLQSRIDQAKIQTAPTQAEGKDKEK